MQWKPHTLAVSMLFFLSACSDTSPLMVNDVDTTDGMAGNFSLSVPSAIATARAVDLDALFARVFVNGEEQPVTDETFTSTFTANQGSTVAISVMWYERQATGTDDLLLASWADSRQISDDISIDVTSDLYDTGDGPDEPVGGSFDADSDGFSNLTERREGSDPYSNGENPINRPDVRIRWVNPVEAPVIDGLYDSIWSDRAIFNDINGELLAIDNLMINQGAVRNNGNTEFRWFAMHDDSNLYVFVLGENVSKKPMPTRDSSTPWNDDSVNLFIDGNNSREDAYDGVDDRHLSVPLLTDPGNLSQNSTFFVNGPSSAQQPNFEFANCLCSSDQHTWEFKLPFDEFNISKDTPFGLDIQIDVDTDGGERDARWGWFHPARTTEDVDNTWTTPSFMGTAVVE